MREIGRPIKEAEKSSKLGETLSRLVIFIIKSLALQTTMTSMSIELNTSEITIFDIFRY
jgi:hypothetical protein